MANEFKVKKGLIVQGSGSTVLDVQGSQGQLFSVTDSLSGSLFSVNDISGMPIMEVFSDDRVLLGTFGAEAIKVSGSFATVTGSLFGTASYALSSNSASFATTSSYTTAISGTVNYIPKFTASGTIGNSIIYDNGTKVGIGTGTPTHKLTSYVSSMNVGNDQEYPFFASVGGKGIVLGYDVVNDSAIINGVETGTSWKNITIAPYNNKVGIGTTSPSEKLDVNGYVKATGFKTPTGTATQALTANGGVFDLTTKADLVDGKVPSSQLPSYVDDVLEFANLASFPATGESGKIYIAIDTNITYRWTGTGYAEISASLALGETSSTAYRGDRGKIAFDHSQTTGNPHGTTKNDIGLGNVDNTSDLNKPISTATQNALNNKLDKGTYTGNAQDLKNDIDNLQIGGRNLILNSELKGVISGFPYLELSEPLIAGQEYTLSFTAKKENPNSGAGWVSVQRVNDWTAEQLNIRISVTDIEYKEYKATFIAKSTAIEQKIWVYSYDYYKIDFKKGIKLEKGNKATDWTPAPEDKQDRLQDITGNIGVGKSDTIATEKLDVNGNVKAISFIKSGGTSTQFLMADGSVSTLTNNVTGTGTTNYLSKFTASGTIGNSIIYDNGTSVGIGTTTPSSYKLNVNGDTNINGTLTATVKSFIIDHPTKPNKKLQYGVLEGPEHSVYFRGKLTNSRIITLPDHWHALVHEDTITVNLTPIGKKQDLWVETVSDTTITVGSDNEINCFYTVFAERKDINKLVTEFDK